MKTDWTVKTLLVVATLFLGMIALRQLVQPLPVLAQSDSSRFYVEPGTTMRKPDGTSQLYGKVFIDMQTGDVWGFPLTSTIRIQ